MQQRYGNRRRQRLQSGGIVLAGFALFGLIFLAIGGLIGMNQNRVYTTWPRAEALVQDSRLSLDSPSTYSARILVTYSVDGQTYEATLAPAFSTSRNDLMQALVARYAPGSRHQLPYDPEHPERISLETGWSLESALLPLIFVGLGLVFLLIGLIPMIWARLPRPAPKNRPYRPSGLGERWVTLLGAGFTALGLIFLGVCLWGGVVRAQQAQWPEVQAEILSSRPFTFTRSKSGTYHAAELQLRYSAGGRDYTALSTADTVSRDEAWVRQALASSHAPGQRIALRYNPARPAEIRFGEGDFTWFWILLFLGTIFTGMGVLVMAVFRPGRTA